MKKIFLLIILLTAVAYTGSRMYITNKNQQAQVTGAVSSIVNGQLMTTSVAQGGTITFKLITNNNVPLTDSQLSKLYIEPIGPNKPIMTITRAGTDTYTARIPTDFPAGSYEVSVFAKLNSGTDMNWYFNETLTVTAAPVVVTPPTVVTPPVVPPVVPPTVPPVVTPPVVVPPATTNGVTDVVVDMTDHNATIKFKVNKGIMQAKIKYKDDLTGVYKSGDNVRQESPQSSTYTAYLDALTPNTTYKFNIELVDFNNTKVTLPTEYSFKTVARFIDSNLYKRQVEQLKNFTVSATPVNQTTNPGLYNVTWNNAAVDVCIYIDTKSASKADMTFNAGKSNTCFAGSNRSAQIQIVQQPDDKGSAKTSSVKIDLKVKPSLSAGSGNFTLPTGFEYAQFSGTNRENVVVFDNSISRIVKDLQLPAVGPKFVSVDKTNVKPGDIVTIKVNEYVYLSPYTGREDILLITNVPRFHDLFASGYYYTVAPVTAIDTVNRTMSFKIPDMMSYVYKNQYNVATSRREFHGGDYYVSLRYEGVLNPLALKINIQK